MKENQVSRTAQLTSIFRAYHSMHDTPKIFDDFLAYRLLDEQDYISWEKQIISLYYRSTGA